MKKLVMFTLLTLVAGTSMALARGGGPGHGRHFFEHLDRNDDGKVTMEEVQAEAKARFSELDKNRDGAVTEDELPARGHGGKMCEHGDKPKK